jgi:polyhydroxyalkanoate synthesis regulator phasin
MMDVIKKTLLAGVGAAVITKEKVEAALQEFVKEGKVTTTEAREMADKIAEQGRREFETLSHELNEKIRDRLMGNERRLQQQIAALEARVAALEQLAGVASQTKAESPNPAGTPGV